MEQASIIQFLLLESLVGLSFSILLWTPFFVKYMVLLRSGGFSYLCDWMVPSSNGFGVVLRGYWGVWVFKFGARDKLKLYLLGS